MVYGIVDRAERRGTQSGTGVHLRLDASARRHHRAHLPAEGQTYRRRRCGNGGRAERCPRDAPTVITPRAALAVVDPVAPRGRKSPYQIDRSPAQSWLRKDSRRHFCDFGTRSGRIVPGSFPTRPGTKSLRLGRPWAENPCRQRTHWQRSELMRADTIFDPADTLRL